MRTTIKICGVQSVYSDYLREFDRVVSKDPTQNRKFVGILLEVNDFSYYAPMSSPKPKHEFIAGTALDVIKIERGRLGLINLNNMIPVLPPVIIPIHIASEPEHRYRQLLMKQMLYVRKNEEAIKKKAKRLYQIVKSRKQPKLNARCCDFLILEQMALQFGAISPVTAEEAAPASSENNSNQ